MIGDVAHHGIADRVEDLREQQGEAGQPGVEPRVVRVVLEQEDRDDVLEPADT